MNNRAPYQNFIRAAVIAMAFAAPAFILVQDAYGQAMSSTNYKIQTDSVNFGGNRSSSASYNMEDTAGEIATGFSSSTNFVMSAGYQQMQDVVLSIIPPSNVTLSPVIGGVTGGTANGATTFTVTTDDPAGYSVTIQASSSPAMKTATDSFADYVPGGANPDFTFTNAPTTSHFAFSPKGTDIIARYKDDGAANCGTGSNQTAGACWDGLSTTPILFVTRNSSNQPSGTVTTLNFRAASGSSHLQTNGTYVATTTITVTAL